MPFIVELFVATTSGLVVAVLLSLANRMLNFRKAHAARAWFGSSHGDEWLVSLPRFYGDQRAVSFSLLKAVDQISRLADSIGCKVVAVPNDEVRNLGESTEVSIGGGIEGRPAVHLRTWIPSVTLTPWDDKKDKSHAMVVDGQSYIYDAITDEYALLARINVVEQGKPLFLIVGQGATADVAAATYLAKHHRSLRRRFGDEPFSLLLRIRDSGTYGTSLTEEVRTVDVKHPGQEVTAGLPPQAEAEAPPHDVHG